jgi:hypothetical protein
MLVHGFVRQPMKYGKQASFLRLRTEEFKNEVDTLQTMLSKEG